MGKKRRSAFVVLLLSMVLSSPITIYATSLDALVATTKEATEAQTQETQAQNETKRGNKNGTDDSFGDIVSNNDSSFANQLAGVANLSKADVSTTKFSSTVNRWCTILFQYITSLAVGGYLVVIALDILYILVPPLRPLLSNGNRGVASGGASQNTMPMGNTMNTGYGRGSFNTGTMNPGMNTGQSMQNNSNSPLRNMCFISNAALNIVESQASGASSVSPIVLYMKEMGINAIVSVLILVLAASGVLAKVGVFLAFKAIGLINGALAGAM